jgi:hypothetical protein
MRFEVLAQFFGQPVEVAILSKTHSGVLRQSENDNGSHDIVELEPLSDYYQKRFGSWVLDVEVITSIRPIKTHVDEDDEDCKAECDDSN